jgi:hypothetical protein
MTERLGPYLLGPNETPENGIYTGDARELASAIPDNSVDLIFTDPVYQNIDDYRWLAETAARVLKPDSACLAWFGIGWLPDVHAALSEHLSYRWRLVVRALFGPGNGQWHGRLQVGAKEIAWYEKGKSHLWSSIFDVNIVSHNEQAGLRVDGATWGKSIAEIQPYILAFCQPNDAIIDPFTGGGTVPAVCKMLGRKYLAFEIIPETAEFARQRVRETQPPLFVPKMGQLKLEC